MKILLVEDHLDTAEAIKSILELEGHEVRICLDGRDALTAAKLGPWADAVVLDHYLPGMDGRAFLTELNGTEGWESIPVILATGISTSDAINVTTSIPGDRRIVVLQKPFDPSELTRALIQLAP